MTSRRTRGGRRYVLWASTTPDGPGGVAAYVRLMRESDLWGNWGIRHVSTHRPGAKWRKIVEFLRGAGQFLWLLVSDRPAAVHVHMASRGSFVRKATLVWLALLFRVPVIVHVHGSYFDQFHRDSPRPVRAAIAATLNHADMVIALGDRWARVLAGIAPKARIVAIANPIRVEAPVAQPPAGEPVQVVFLGDVTADKGVFVLLGAWARVLAGGDAAVPPRLVIAGDGQMGQARRRAEELGLGESVRFPGWIAPAQVQELLRQSQVFTLPSHYEGQPMAILEAMAHGLCVVTTPVGGIPEMLGEHCGFFVPPGDEDALATALRTAVADGAQRTARGAAARDMAMRRCDVDVVSRQLDELYREVAR